MMDRGHWANLAITHPYSFSKGILGVLYNHKELGSQFNVSSEG